MGRRDPQSSGLANLTRPWSGTWRWEQLYDDYGDNDDDDDGDGVGDNDDGDSADDDDDDDGADDDDDDVKDLG